MMNDKKAPTVSVVIPTYNRSAILRDRAIRSIQDQTLKDWECIIIDDGSTDDTEQVVQMIAVADPRVRYIKKPNGGQASARNLGIRESCGEFVAFTDDDDEFLPGYLEAAVAQFRALPTNITFLSCGSINRDESGIETYYMPELEPFWKFSIGNGWVFRRSVFFEHNLFFEEGIIGFEDLDLRIRFHLAGEKGMVFPEPLRIYYAMIRSKKTASWSTNYGRHVVNFDLFFKKNRAVYEAAGPDAMAWIGRYGAIVRLRNGGMREGRKFLLMSFRAKPSFYVVLYWCVSLFGYRFFVKFDSLKNRLMRLIRSRITNRPSHHA